MREVRFYRTASGQCPVEVFLDGLAGQQAQKVIWVLRLIEELDRVPVQYLKKLIDAHGLWEVRAQHGNDIFRLLGFFDGPDLLMLTSGFAKKSRRTPRREIELARSRRADYMNRRQGHE